ncbi:RNA polymerase III subunit RPC82-related helix-turn-helix [Arabidopsis thaliana x Arabidopsis arenosa]|uniref:DNA-directed RNA polymerase III subunit RPC3 n=1 Tax=Arabidopsis thaliana x Arabidopsis arenosa TaxID=1240361 RepID=A0A8T1Z0V1_9BRAS|nr:RNA polymerase III subunit RPC82-related helix-turn-helix [Arabidopsis thaliana x Arabidopsis arenosa]
MAMSEFGIVYAVHIITVQFGSVVSKVCECLLRKGPLSSRDISRLAESDINHNQVKHILYLLIQHNCVQAFSIEPPDGSESKAIVQYIVLFNNILHRVRYNKFSRIVNEELGSECGAVLDGLLSNGRLRLGQLIERDRDSGKTIGSEAIRDSLQKLVAARFVERIPSPEPVLGNKDQEPAKKRGAKAAKILKEPETLEERVVEAATPVDAIRFPLIFEEHSNSSLADDDSNITEGKRKQRDVDSSDPSSGVIWRPNFEEFIHRLRHKACVEIVKERRDEGCAIVLRAMLEVGRSQEKKVKTDNSAPMSVGSIYEEVIKTEAGRTMLQERVEACLDQLSATSSYLPAFVTEMNDSYIVDFKSIISVAQKDEIEAVVMRRYGKEAFRMFRYLSQEGRFVETDKIADAALTEKKDTPQILLKMWKDGYLHMQKLAITGTYVPFLLWKVNKLIVTRQMLDEMYHASLNLNLRLAHELESEKELLMLPSDKLEGPLKERVKKVRAKRLLLSSTMFKLDDAIMLFHDF